MFLISREPLLGDNNKALNIVFYISAAVLIILLCTVVILHCILRRQLRQYVQSSPHSITVILQLEVHITGSGSESFVQEKTDHDNTVSSIQISQNTTFSKEEPGCPFRFSHLSPSNLEKASDNDLSNRMILCPSVSDGRLMITLNTVTGPTIARPVPSYTPVRQTIGLTNT